MLRLSKSISEIVDIVGQIFKLYICVTNVTMNAPLRLCAFKSDAFFFHEFISCLPDQVVIINPVSAFVFRQPQKILSFYRENYHGTTNHFVIVRLEPIWWI